MKKIILISLLFIFQSFPSFSDWEYFTKNKRTGSSVYIDLTKNKTVGKYIYWWILFDFNSPRKGVLSRVMYMRSDCVLSKFQYVQYTLHSSQMGKNNPLKVVDNPNPKEWRHNIPGSIWEKVNEKVCNYLRN